MAVVLSIAAVALAGGVSAGAGTTGTVSATIDSVLNDQGTLVLGTPTPGKNIGYTFTLQNTGTNTINHIVLNAWISSDSAGTNKVGAVVYAASSDPNLLCSGSPTLKCTETQLAAGAKFTLTIIFSTNPSPSAGEQIYPNFSGTYAPESQNTSNNRSTTTKSYTADNSGSIRSYTGTQGNTFAQSLTLPTDPLDVGAGSFTAAVKMPPGFLNNNNYVGVTLQTIAGALPPAACGSCLAFETATTIPLAATFGSGGPFFDGTATSGYTWSFTIPVPSSFKPSLVYHTDDLGGNGTVLPSCSAAGALTTAPGLCVASITLNKRTNQATYSGFGVANGSTWGG